MFADDLSGSGDNGKVLLDLTRWKGCWPREQKDQLAMCFAVCFSLLWLVFELAIVIPYRSSVEGSSYLYSSLFLCFCTVNFLGNLYRLITSNPNGGNADLPSVLKPDYRFCQVCRLNAPPRAYHCPSCERCIWKRDHHCSIAGCCVGYFNHRYYFCAMLYAFVGMVTCVWLNFPYSMEAMGEMRAVNAWVFLVPHMAFLMQFISIRQFAVVCSLGVTLSITGLIAFFFGGQLFCLAHGQTRPEYLLGARHYYRGRWASFVEMMGRYWPLGLLFFATPHRLNGDGINFARDPNAPGGVPLPAESIKDM